ncbi:MAG: penicillin-binding transpeptidase domain-containing protein [Acidobacteriota bacterium]|nr:penicillin-binding transpeptidase domain-containing protein [Acidobacteriota bacterium]
MREIDHFRANVLSLARAFTIAFAVMAIGLAYWHVVRAPQLRADAHNPRTRERIKLTEPGRLLASDGSVILEGVNPNGEWYLEYAEPEVYCHLTGYNDRTGLQASLRDPLYGMGEYEDPWTRLLRGRPRGCDVYLTINAEAQRLAAGLMEGQRGAVVALEPSTGNVLVMVSAPAYNPAFVLDSAADYAAFTQSDEKYELNRALQGQYVPGSVLKILTAAAALDKQVVSADDQFSCTGTHEVNGATVRCRRPSGHGTIDLEEAMVDSCNVVFAQIGQALGPEEFRKYVNAFHLLDRPDVPLPASGGRMATMEGPEAQVEVAEAAFGQGATLVSPAAIARLAATIANGGSVPRLTLVDHIVGPNGKEKFRSKPESLGQAVSPATAREVAGMMVEVVERGTGRSAHIRGVEVAGKTGSAQNPSGAPHAWFAGFAPADAPKVAIAVIIEHGGAGSSIAAPIARQVMERLM